MKLARKCVLSILIALSCILFGAGFFGISAKTAKADTPTIELAGASIRYESSITGDQGIRFVGNADKAQFNDLASKNSNLSVKVIIASLTNLKNAGITPEAFNKDSAVYMHEIEIYRKTGGEVVMDRWTYPVDNDLTPDVDESKTLTANIYIWKIKEANYPLFWVAKMYYTTGSTPVYSNYVNMSMSEIAYENYDKASAAEKEKLNAFMKNYDVKWIDDKGVEIETDEGQKYGTSFTSIAPSVTSKTGYNIRWAKRTGGTDLSPTWGDPIDITDVYVQSQAWLKLVYVPITYTITYEGLDAPNGAETKTTQTSYNIETATFTISDPTTSHNNYFLGWTYEGQSTPVYNPTITKGTTGNKTFTANWGDFTVPDDDYVYEGYYGLFEPKAVSGYNITKSNVTYTSYNPGTAAIDGTNGHKIVASAVASATDVTIGAKIGNATHGYVDKAFVVTVKDASDADEYGGKTLNTDMARHKNNQESLAMFNHSGDLTLFMGASFMSEIYFKDFYTTRYLTKNAYLVGVGGSRTTHWRFFVQDYISYAPVNIVLGLGGNDLFTNSGAVPASQAVENLIKVFEVIHEALPTTKVYWWTSGDRYNSSWERQYPEKVTELNAGITAYAEGKDWLTLVEVRSLLTTDADYEESGTDTRIHPSVPKGYDRCMAATVAAGLNLTENTFATTNIIKDWTTNQADNEFGLRTDKPMGHQARVNKFVWESDVTLVAFTNSDKPHISMSFRNNDSVGEVASGNYNRFFISDSNKDGKFYYSGYTYDRVNKTYNKPNSAEYCTPSAGYTFKLAILVTDTDAYMFVDGVLVEVFMNPVFNDTTTAGDKYFSFRVGTVKCSATFANNRISNEYLNPTIYNEYLNNETVQRCDADTSITEQILLTRIVTFNVYNNSNFTANGVTITFTNTSTSKNYTGVVDDNKLKMFGNTAGEFVSGTYNVTASFSGLTATLYTNATVSVAGSTYTINGGNIRFNNLNSGYWENSSTNNWVNIDLANGKYSRTNVLASYYDLCINNVTSITTSFYVAVLYKCDLTNWEGNRARFGVIANGHNITFYKPGGNDGGKVLINSNQDGDYDSGTNIDKTVLRDKGYWLVFHQDISTGVRTVYLSDATCSYLTALSTTKQSNDFKTAPTSIGTISWKDDYGGHSNPYPFECTNFRVGTTLEELFGESITVTTSATNCAVELNGESSSTVYMEKGSAVTLSVKPNDGYHVTGVTLTTASGSTSVLNSMAGNQYTFYPLVDCTINVTVATIAEETAHADTTITVGQNRYSTTTYKSYDNIGLTAITWQGFMGVAAGFTLDDTTAHSGATDRTWQVATYINFTRGNSFILQVQNWDRPFPAIKYGQDGATSHYNLTTNADLLAKLVADRGLTLRMVMDDGRIDVYALGGDSYTVWYFIGTHTLQQGEPYIASIGHAKDGSRLNKSSGDSPVGDTASGRDAYIRNEVLTAYAKIPEYAKMTDYAKGDGAEFANTKFSDVPNLGGSSFWWSGFMGWTGVPSNSALYSTTDQVFLQIAFYGNGINYGWLQLLHWSGHHIIKWFTNGSYYGAAQGYTFYSQGNAVESGSIEEYYRANGGVYLGVSIDYETDIIRVYYMDNRGEWWNCLTINPTKSVPVDRIEEMFVGADFAGTGINNISTYGGTDIVIRDQMIGSYDGNPEAVSGSKSALMRPVRELNLYNNYVTMEKGYKYHFVNRVNMSGVTVEDRTKAIASTTVYNVNTTVRFWYNGSYPRIGMQIANWAGNLYINAFYGKVWNSNDYKISRNIYSQSDENGKSLRPVYDDWLAGLSLTFEVVMYRDENDYMKSDYYVYDGHGVKYTIATNYRPVISYNSETGEYVYWDTCENANARYQVNGFLSGDDNCHASLSATARMTSEYSVIYRTH